MVWVGGAQQALGLQYLRRGEEGAPCMQHSPEPGASESPLDSADVAWARAQPSSRPVVSSAVTPRLLDSLP